MKKRYFGNGSGIGFGAAAGVAISFALGNKSDYQPQIIALGLALGVAFGALIDFWSRPK
jgi:hypothetical protein